MNPEICPVGETPEPPYFFGASDTPFLKSTGNAFETPGWISHCRASAERLSQQRWTWIDYRQWGGLLLFGHHQMQRHLYPLKSLISRKIKEQKKVRILDIGGSFGDNYKILKDAIKFSNFQIFYTIVDNALSCELGTDIFDEVRFLTEIPDEEFDIAVIIGTIQYIPDWENFLDSLSKKVDCIYIARTPIHNNGNTFYTHQAVCPALGESALSKVGSANLTVISKNAIMNKFERMEWALKFCELHADYSSHFKRLPSKYHNVSYYNMAWTRQHGKKLKSAII